MTKRINTTKLIALLAVLCMITSAFVGSTLAKYTTKADGSDSARVAKWGVTLTVPTDSSFDTEYKNTSDTITVKSSDTERVAAPGTEGNAITFKIEGTPEVATDVDIEMTVNSDIHTSDYYPVVFTLSQNGTVLETGNLATIEKFIEDWATSTKAEYAPNVALDAEFTLDWAWAYSVDDTTDALDTKLGDIAAGTINATADDSTELNYEITFRVTQVD